MYSHDFIVPLLLLQDPLFPKFSELKYKKYKLRDNNGEPTVVCCGKTKAKWMVTEQSLLDRIILWYHENGKPNRNGMCEFFLTDYCVDGKHLVSFVLVVRRPSHCIEMQNSNF
jgi:hypothetical protein